ncbi:MAG: putative Fe-S cluster assembly protein SufT [Verrucomicrobiota bacterium]
MMAKAIKPGDDYTLINDCPAVKIPSGEPCLLEKDEEISITQALGGSVTVMSRLGMVRIDTKHLASLGLELEAPAETESTPVEEEDLEKAVWNQLKEVYDPEIPVNIVDLGLVYSMKVDEGEKTQVNVKMTLTAPGCGMGPVIQQDAQSRVESIAKVDECLVELVWDPPWDQEMISEVGKMKLGMI